MTPAYLNMLLRVPGAKSSDGFPATVTRPGLSGMPELLVATPLGGLPPPVALDQPDDLVDLH